MTRDQIGKVTSRYLKIYVGHGYIPVENQEAGTPDECIQHALWMCEEIVTLLAQDKKYKAIRWLGFIEGVLFSAGENTTKELKEQRVDDHPLQAYSGRLH